MNVKKWVRILFVVGVFSIAVSIPGSAVERPDFFRSYLYGFLYWLDPPLGALFVLMIHKLTSGDWGKATHGIFEALSDTIYPFALFVVPVLIGLSSIYPWMDTMLSHDPRIIHKHVYLNAEAFIVRTVIYFACWLILNRLLRTSRSGALAAGGLIVAALAATFASIDWQMSVEPFWYSTMYGLVYSVGQALQSFAFALVVFGIYATTKAKVGAGSSFSPKTLRDLGNLLLTLVVLWTYVSFMQYLIVWSGDLPHETTWFLHRSHGGWQWLVLAVAVFQFAAPFAILLFRGAKSTPMKLALIGGLILVIRGVDHYWMLMPGLYPEHFELPWRAITLWLGIGSIWLALFFNRLSRAREVFSYA